MTEGRDRSNERPISASLPEAAPDPERTLANDTGPHLAGWALRWLVGRMNSKAFPFHDGYLASVSVGERTAVLGLKQVGGGEFVMTLGGVEALSIDGVREGNIILDLWMVSGKQPTSEDLQTMKLAEVMEVLFPGPHPSAAAQYHQAHAAVLETKLEKVRSGEAALVLLVPAYGADLYAFCASVDLQPPVPPLPLR